MLVDANTVINSNLTVYGSTVLNSNLTVNDDMLVNGNTVIDSNLTVNGILTASNLVINGETTTLYTTVYQTEKLEVVSEGLGPALYIKQIGDQDVMQIYDDNKIAFSIINGGNVGINKLTPTSELDVSGTFKSDNAIINSNLTVNSETILNSNVIVKGDIIPDSDITYDLGSSTNKWRDLYLSGNTIILGNSKISSDPDTKGVVIKDDTNQITSITAAAISIADPVTGNVTKIEKTNKGIKFNEYRADDTPVINTTLDFITSNDIINLGYTTSNTIKNLGYATSNDINSLGYTTSNDIINLGYTTSNDIINLGYTTSNDIVSLGYVTSNTVYNLGYITESQVGNSIYSCNYTTFANYHPTIKDSIGTDISSERLLNYNNDYYYAFSSPGNYSINFTKPTICDVLIVGGGGSGSNLMGGGSSGGLLYAKDVIIPSGTYSISVGAGGTIGTNGGYSEIFGARAIGGIGATTTSGASGTGTNIIENSIGASFTSNAIAKVGGGYTTTGIYLSSEKGITKGLVADNPDKYYYSADSSISVKYPREPVTDLTTTYTDGTVVTVKATSQISQNYNISKMFNDNINDGWWSSSFGPSGVARTTYMTNYPAEVAFIDLGESIVLNNFIIEASTSTLLNECAPKKGRMYATNDSNTFNNNIYANWIQIYENNAMVNSTVNVLSTVPNSYRYYAFATNTTKTANGYGVHISELKLYSKPSVNTNINTLLTTQCDFLTTQGGAPLYSIELLPSTYNLIVNNNGWNFTESGTTISSGSTPNIILRIDTSIVGPFNITGGGGGTGTLGITGNFSNLTPSGGDGTAISIRTPNELFAGGGGGNGGTRVPSNAIVGYGGNSSSTSSTSGGDGIVIIKWKLDDYDGKIKIIKDEISGSGFINTNTNAIINSNLTVNSETILNSNVIVKGDIIPDSDITYDLGSSTNKWRDLYLSGNTITLGNSKISSDPDTKGIVIKDDTNQITSITAAAISIADPVTGNVTKIERTNNGIKFNEYSADDTPIIDTTSDFITSNDISILGYTTSNAIKNLGYATSNDISILGYTTSNAIKNLGYATSNDISILGYTTSNTIKSLGYVTSNDISSLGYTTSNTIKDLGYATSNDISSLGYTTSNTIKSLGYVTSNDISSLGYATSNAVNNIISNYNFQSIINSSLSVLYETTYVNISYDIDSVPYKNKIGSNTFMKIFDISIVSSTNDLLFASTIYRIYNSSKVSTSSILFNTMFSYYSLNTITTSANQINFNNIANITFSFTGQVEYMNVVIVDNCQVTIISK